MKSKAINKLWVLNELEGFCRASPHVVIEFNDDNPLKELVDELRARNILP